MGTPHADDDAGRQGGRHRAPAGLRRPAAAAVIVAVLLVGVAGVTALATWHRTPGATATLVPAPSATGTPLPGDPPSTATPDPATPSGSPPPPPFSGTGTRTGGGVPTSGAAHVRTGYTGIEDQVVALTNQARAHNGCAALRTDERLRTAARAHSVDMATHNDLSHTGSDGSSFSDRAERAGYPQPMSENIADGYATAEAVVNAWLNSPGHRSNILNCQTRAVGIGLAYASNGTPYWTQDFGRI